MPRTDGFMMESKDGIKWWLCRPHGMPVKYSKLRRYLISIRYSGMYVIFTRNLWHTAYDICEEYWYHQKGDHTSLLEVPKLAIPQMNFRPSLTRMWANDINGIGVKLGMDAERLFKKPKILANADESEWMRIPGIGAKTALDIVGQINGRS